jgi:hypothetical protein
VGLLKILRRSSERPSSPKEINVKNITNNSDLKGKELFIYIPKWDESGKIIAKRMEIKTISKTPPPTGVPAFIS